MNTRGILLLLLFGPSSVREEGSPVSSAPVEVFQNEAFEEAANTPFTPLHLAEADADSSEDYRASLGGLGTDTNAEDLRPTPIGHFGYVLVFFHEVRSQGFHGNVLLLAAQ